MGNELVPSREARVGPSGRRWYGVPQVIGRVVGLDWMMIKRKGSSYPVH
jgi:hypothetical protein